MQEDMLICYDKREEEEEEAEEKKGVGGCLGFHC